MGTTRPAGDGADTATFGRLLRRHRMAAGLSQEQLAERAGVSARGISDLERGVRGAPRPDTLALLLDALGLSPGEQAALVATVHRSRVQRPPPVTAVDRPVLTPLPVPLSPLIGREREVTVLGELLCRSEIRLVTLTGPGGTGKTRLAIRVAQVLADCFAEGVCYAPLAPIHDPRLVGTTIAQALGLSEGADAPFLERLVALLRDRRLLLVLDNFEQVVEAAPFVADLLAACPSLTVLATSRERLRISGERAYPVQPLSLPSPSEVASLDRVGNSEPVSLFVERAKGVDSDFALTYGNAGTVAEICRRLDGLPLALELAAARINVLRPQAMLVRLEYRLPLLVTGARDQPDRLRTMRNAIAWSYDLLPPPEQTLFRRLAVFVGGFTLEAAEAVIGDPASHGVDVLEGVASLVDKSLLREEDGPDGEPRFLMLETVREFGVEQLAASGEEQDIRRRHAGWCLSLAENAEATFWGPGQGRLLARLESEHPNLRAVLGWLLDAGKIETSLRLACALNYFWYAHNHLAEGRGWIERALSSGGGSPEARAQALAVASGLAHGQGDAVASMQLAEASVALWREIAPSGPGLAFALLQLGVATFWSSDLNRAEAVDHEALALFRALGNRTWTAQLLTNLAAVSNLQGDNTRALALAHEALTIQREDGNEWGIGVTLTNLGSIAASQGRYEEALEHFRGAMAVAVDQSDRWRIADVLSGLGTVAASAGRAEWAARLLGAAAGLRQRIGQQNPAWNRGRHDRAVALARRCLGNAAFDAAWAAGEALSLEEAVAEAMRDNLTKDPTSIMETTAAGLSSREVEVLRLVASGKTDGEIAAALFVSKRTVGTHLTNILAKLDLANRTEAAAWAVRHGVA